MFYVWFIPLLAAAVVGIWVMYVVLMRNQPKVSSRSVEDALAEEPEMDAVARDAGEAKHVEALGH
jgi:hypothetical protein